MRAHGVTAALVATALLCGGAAPGDDLPPLIPREVLFPHLGIPAEQYDLSPRKLFLGW